MTGAFLAGLVAGYGVAIPVGAIAILILGLSARTSFRVGAAAALAVATADGLYAAVAVLGGAGLADVIAPVAGPLRVVAAVVLLGLAGHRLWRTWSAHRSRRPPTARAGRGMSTPGRAYAALLGLTLLNPMTRCSTSPRWCSAVGTRPIREWSPWCCSLPACSWRRRAGSWSSSAVGRWSRRALTGPRGRLVTGLVSSALIAALAVAAVLPG